MAAGRGSPTSAELTTGRDDGDDNRQTDGRTDSWTRHEFVLSRTKRVTPRRVASRVASASTRALRYASERIRRSDEVDKARRKMRTRPVAADDSSDLS